MRTKELIICPCCGNYTIPEIFEICEVCFWQYDVTAHNKPDFAGGANKVSLNEARHNYTDFGASERRFIDKVRTPFPNELPKNILPPVAEPTNAAIAVTPPLTYPIYLCRTYPEMEGETIVYSFGYSPDNLFAKFGVNSEHHTHYGIETAMTVDKEALETVTDRLYEYVMAQPELKYPQKLVIERDGVSGVEW